MAKQIIVGVDIRDLKIAKTGQKTSLEELCRQFTLFDHDGYSFHFFDSTWPAYTGRNKFLIALGHIRYQVWKQIVLPFKAWKNKCDILFCADYFVPYLHPGFKTVQIFHDAFFYEYPEHYNRLWLRLFRHIAIPAARRSAYIVVPTHYARLKIHQHFKFPEKKLIPVYEGPKSLPAGAKKEPGWLKDLKGSKYLLHVGVMEKRKNLPMLIKAFRKLIDAGYTDYRLVLAGQGSGKINSDDSRMVHQAIAENQLENHVMLLGYVPDDELSIAYANAFMYVFPSYNEGFGIPILEAFSFGLPVIVADNSCLPEVGADAVITFNPFNADDIFQKMKLVIDDDSLRNELIEKGKERLHFFSWEKAGKEIMSIFKQALLV